MAEEKQEKPEVPKKLFDSAFYNGFGFQLHRDEYLVVAFLWEYDGKSIERLLESDATKIFQEQGFQGVSVDSWLTRTYLEVHWQQYDRIPDILQFALDAGFSLTLQSKLDVYYKAGDRFDPLKVEEKYVKQFFSIIERFPQRDGFHDPDPWLLAYQSRWQLLPLWNWASPAGQAFCRQLQKHFPNKVSEEDADTDKYNYFKFAGVDEAARKYKLLQYGKWWFGKPAIAPAPPSPPPPAAPAPPSAPPTPPALCVICEERPANTLVIPCGHVVVCFECSEQLKKTPDRDVCVQCRSKIDEVMHE
jgi:hypothetical protein